MTYVIVTKRKGTAGTGEYEYGSTAQHCGMSLKTERGVRMRCLRTGFCNGEDKIRIEWFYTKQHGHPHATTYHQFTWQEHQEVKDMFTYPRSKYKRPAERMLGNNRRMIRQIVGACHVGQSLLHVARAARPKNFRKAATPELRRGWALCVIQTWKRNRKEYCDVMSGRIG